MGEWSFVTNHARVLACIAQDPGVRIRDIAATLDITERSAFGILTDLITAGYVEKNKDGRRNRYRIQVHAPLRKETERQKTVGELLAVLVDTKTRAELQPSVEVTD
ncbi:MAG: helix-turn-helix domain-containing protein [Acidimicrobiales bacterium]|jgi:DNA-binding IclR family transcriptional regulator